jgi:hypothetical protein
MVLLLEGYTENRVGQWCRGTCCVKWSIGGMRIVDVAVVEFVDESNQHSYWLVVGRRLGYQCICQQGKRSVEWDLVFGEELLWSSSLCMDNIISEFMKHTRDLPSGLFHGEENVFSCITLAHTELGRTFDQVSWDPAKQEDYVSWRCFAVWWRVAVVVVAVSILLDVRRGRANPRHWDLHRLLYVLSHHYVLYMQMCCIRKQL